MSTTVLFVELLVCGAQAAVWMLLLAIAIFGSPDVLALWKRYTTEVGAMLVVWAYSMGVIFDRVWDMALKRFERRIKEKYFKGKEAELHATREKIFSSSGGLPAFVDYMRSRMRIARATFCNSFLCTAMALWVIAWDADGIWSKSYIAVIVVGLVVIIVSLFAFEDISDSYFKTLSGLKIGNGQPTAAPVAPAPVAPAPVAPAPVAPAPVAPAPVAGSLSTTDVNGGQKDKSKAPKAK